MRKLLLRCSVICAAAASVSPLSAQTITISATAETEPVGTAGDAADDPAIWRNEKNPEKSLIIATDKKAGVHVYDLAGKRRSFTASPRLNNIDLRADIMVRNKRSILVAASDRRNETNAKIALFRLNPVKAKLKPIGSIMVGAGEAYGMCLWTRKRDGALFAFVVMKDGRIDQLAIDFAGKSPKGRVVRSMKLATQSEGCVVDDRTGILYVAEEGAGLWRFDAEPEGSAEAIFLAKIDNATLFADAEGLALAPAGADAGYLIASSQGDNAYAIYSLPSVTFVGRFRIRDSQSGSPIDAVSETDGIELMLGDFGKDYPSGLFVAQDGDNAPQTQNFKLVSWQKVVQALGLK